MSMFFAVLVRDIEMRVEHDWNDSNHDIWTIYIGHQTMEMSIEELEPNTNIYVYTNSNDAESKHVISWPI